MLKFFVLLAVCLLASCMNLKVEVADYSRFDTKIYSHYAWTNEPMVDASGRQELNARVDAILRVEVNRQLQDRGYQLVARDKADFLVDYRFIQTMDADQGGIVSPTDEAAAAWDIGADVNKTSLHNHSINAYILRTQFELLFTDPKGEALWQASASKLVDNESPDDSELYNMLTKITGKMFSGFPRQH